MKKLFTILAVALCSTLAMAQTNQYFWANGQFIIGNPIGQIDSVTFGELEQTDSITLYLPRTIKVMHDTVIQKEIIHDTIYVNNCDSLNWKGLIIEAIAPNTIVKFDTHRTTGGLYFDPNMIFDETTIPGNLYYSYDAEIWQEWNCRDSIVLCKGQRICVKGNRPYYGILDNGMYFIETSKGETKVYGYISSLFDNGDTVITTEYPDCSLACNAGRRFFMGNCTATLSFPEGVDKIGTNYIFSYSFANRGLDSLGITAIKLPNTLTYLGCTCFEGAQITELTIPHSVEYIGNAAFCGCEKLTTVYYLGTKEEWNVISKGNYKYNSNIPAQVVHCTDGDVAF